MGHKNCRQLRVEPDESQLKEISIRTGLSKEQLFLMHQEFVKDCPNGRLSQKMFTKMYNQFYTNGNAKKFCKLCFMAYDRDKNGYIDFYEYASVMGILLNGDIKDKLKLAFNIYDCNDDGHIEKKEAEKIVQSIFEMYGESLPSKAINNEALRLMQKFDSDKNGLITEKEFIEGCLRDDDLKRIFVPLFNT
ncbi:Neuronal calcium sensor 2 [Brachionus plicatilis]|uniref:Neuronal calcium sensor 2 n=1 Tax=Brachionus plicatilis TaxID=10195 RepID=A0A3M7R805_BRAPC|nr:Neuronal calcium sensor 2 [Brachionus plicatilis]